MQIVDIRLTKLLFCVHKPDKSEGRDLYSLCVSLDSCEKICVGTVLFVDPGYLILVAEVVDADQLFGWLARMDSSCSRLLKMRPWIVSASALFRASAQLKRPLWSQRGSAALEMSVL